MGLIRLSTYMRHYVGRQSRKSSLSWVKVMVKLKIWLQWVIVIACVTAFTGNQYVVNCAVSTGQYAWLMGHGYWDLGLANWDCKTSEF